ncbi:MAG: carboxypeptidase regulatory-like domain-containing protein [Flavobacteriales bacterium]|nr:carboxypeptidase regulatory-like domain-containing protein [Flavobacteriales bacterium]
MEKKKKALYRYTILTAMCFIFLGINTQISYGQLNAQSTFQLGKQKAQKAPIPGEGSIKGDVVIVGKGKKVPLAFIEVEDARSIQADRKGKFNLVLAQGTYKIKINCSGYKDLIINTIAVVEGMDQFIKIELAVKDKGKKFK